MAVTPTRDRVNPETESKPLRRPEWIKVRAPAGEELDLLEKYVRDYGADGFIQVIRTGKSGTLSPLMPWIAFRELDDADLRAIHLALQRLAPVAHFMHNALPPTQCPVCLQAHGLGDRNHVHEPEAVAVPVAELASCVGRYRARQGGEVLEVRHVGGVLGFGDAERQTRLVPLGNDRYAAPGGLLPVRFERDPQGAVVRLVEQDVEDYIWDRVRD